MLLTTLEAHWQIAKVYKVQSNQSKQMKSATISTLENICGAADLFDFLSQDFEAEVWSRILKSSSSMVEFSH